MTITLHRKLNIEHHVPHEIPWVNSALSPLLTSCLSISFQWQSDIPIPVVPSLPHMYIITILLNVFSSNTAHITLSKNKVIKLLVAPVVSKFT